MAETKNEKGDKADKGAKPGKAEKPAAKGAKPDAAAADAKGAKGKARKEAGSEIAAAGAVKAAPKDYVARLKKLYQDEIVPRLTKEFGYKNPLEVPRLDKIVLNMGVGEAVNDTKKVTSAAADLAPAPYVRVPRSSGHGRVAAGARLPRSRSEVVRRTRQLRARRQGTHHLS